MDSIGNITPETQLHMKNANRASSKIGFALTGMILIVYIIILPVSYCLSEFTDIQLAGTIWELLLNYIPLYGLGFLFVFLLTRNIPVARASKSTLSNKQFFMFLILAYGFSGITNLTATLINLVISSSFSAQEALVDIVNSNLPFSFLVMVVVAPVVEELIFRKIIVDRLVMYSEKYAIVISAICFGLYHRNLQQIMYAAVIGAVFAYVYTKTGRIHYTMMMHSIINLLGFLAALGTIKMAPFLASLENLGNAGINQSDLTELAKAAPFYLLTAFISQLMMASIVISIILLIRKVTKIRFPGNAAYQIPVGREFVTLYRNPGMIVLTVLCLLIAVLQIIGIL